MTPAKSCPPWQRAVITQSAVMIGVIILGILYWARSIIIPIAMALFFSYVLAPVVRTLSRRGLGHSISVLVTVAFATLLFLGTSIVITRQISSLTQTLSENPDLIKTKIAMVRNSLGSENSFVREMFDDVERTIVGGVAEARKSEDGQQSVTITPGRPRWMSSIDQIIGPVTEAFGMAAFSFLLVVFILLAREDMKDRLLRLIGDGSVSNTTRALDDATTRLSQYLLAQLSLNIAFGFIIACGVWALGLKYALLWGFIATLMRYVPYVGSWIGVIFPVLFSFATSDGLWQPLAVLAFYGVLELICGNAVEPFLYGPKLGVSEVAQLVSAAFWSFLWGPIGLILSGPISSCLVVLGRHSPRFHFLEILLGSEPPLAPEVALFQRMITNDTDEAMRIVEKYTPKDRPEQVIDVLIVPALLLVKSAIHSGEFSAEELQALVTTAREVIVNTVENVSPQESPSGDPIEQGRLLIVPARDAADQLAADLLAALLPPSKWKVEMLGVDTLAAELIERLNEFKPDAICIGSLPPAGFVQVRYLCKRLRQHDQSVRILAGRWGDLADADASAQLLEAGATKVDTKIESSLCELAAWRPLVDADEPAGKITEVRPSNGAASAKIPVVVS